MKHIIATEDGLCTRTGVVVSEDNTQLILSEAMRGDLVSLVGTGTHPLLDAASITTEANCVVTAGNIECNELFISGSPVYGTATALLQDRQGSGVDGGDSHSGAQVRNLNHVVANNIDGTVLVDDAFHIPAGTYWFRGIAPVFGVLGHKTFLVNDVGTVYFGYGLSQYAAVGYGNNGLTQTVETFTEPARIALMQYVQTDTTTGYGLGRGVSFSPYSVFSQLIVTQLVKG